MYEAADDGKDKVVVVEVRKAARDFGVKDLTS